ncbi:glucan endo-1-3-beta-glucosidase eglC [Penicillium cataractarum]|uniref:Probable glucan endo-1,3-beta-glucosidase eglC n=1 Tax=Penicillium cataractarum TaxID=2100454 RepID=A0A9W9UZW0_9EURO|nr:glucan endo-1-3-beta-glucosidase eglC [Penicillium cataractarum]KAJ5363668.1 glucan endo-1-3-beta-glucosidase eglC [Penicillium cataractarum]
MFSKQAIALALSIAAAEAAHQGFNYGATKVDGSYNYEADFKTEFQTAKKLANTSGGFTSARLYTMIQGGTTNDPIQAIPAAIAEDTSLLLGLWTSGGNVDNEIAALKSAISTYGESFTKLVVGISVGSEDLYRNSVTGSENDAGVGINPDLLVTYIKEVKSAISGTTLSGASIGHVDTWDAWTNSSNSAVIDEIDWLGFDGYPYYQTTMANGIDEGKSLFDDAVAKTKAVANGKEVWITETGWPVSGPDEGDAVASVANAKQYWDQVGCPLFGETNTWWYMLADAGSSPSFGVTGSTSSVNPLFNLSCNSTSTSSSSASASSSTGSKSGSASSSSVSGFATSSKAGFGVGRSSAHPSQTSTPLISATQTASSSSGTSTSSSSNSGSSSSGSSSSGSSSSDSGSGSSSSSSASATSSTSFNSAARSSGSAFTALAAALILAIAV